MTTPDEDRIARQQHWQRKLGKLKLGAEPLQTQLDRQKRATQGLTIVSGTIGLIFFALFSAFRAPFTGAIVGGLLVLPIISLAWLRFAILRKHVKTYLQEHS